MKVGLWSVWLFGFLLILFSLYATRLLPSQKDRTKHLQDDASDPTAATQPSVTIFSALHPCSGVVGERQILAVRSWLSLSPKVEVVLFARESCMLSSIQNLSRRVSLEDAIDFTFLGTPYFHSMVARSMASGSDISVLVDSETILLPIFFSALSYANQIEYDWILVAAQHHISYSSFNLGDLDRPRVGETRMRLHTNKLEELIVQNPDKHKDSSRWLWAWNTGKLPLHRGVLPPFLYGQGYHNEWLMHEILSTEVRFLFDGTNVVLSLYSENTMSKKNQSSTTSKAVPYNRYWEAQINGDLATSYGSFYFHKKITYDLPKLIDCGGKFTIVNDSSCNSFFHQKHAFLNSNSLLGLWKGVPFLQGHRRKRYLSCMEKCSIIRGGLDIPAIGKSKLKPSVPSFPFSLEALLETIADEEKTIALAVAGNNYKDMLMSWVCRLRHLSISNFIVCALDDEVYKFSLLQGLPVFKASSSQLAINFDNCHFGTKCFQRVTKVKSRIVLKILKMGYNVLMSDVDVYWFQNPLPHLRVHGPTTIVAQSDEYNVSEPINLPRRLNSGFYYVHSDSSTILAMEKVVKHASTSRMSEQPSFYDVLCGEGGKNRLGKNKCREPSTNVTVHFLDRNLFPNGAFKDLWRKRNVTAACMKIGCITIHNNWISGRKKKFYRQITSGLWEYNVESRMCLQGWQTQTPRIYF